VPDTAVTNRVQRRTTGHRSSHPTTAPTNHPRSGPFLLRGESRIQTLEGISRRIQNSARDVLTSNYSPSAPVRESNRAQSSSPARTEHRAATERAPCPDMSRTVTTLSAWVTNWASVTVLPTGTHPRPFRSQRDASSTAPTSSTWASRTRGYEGLAWSGASTRGTRYTVTSKFSTSVDGISLY
jgi:hypothetical protein